MADSPRRNYAQSHKTVRISAKRFAMSPWLPAYMTDETVLGVYSRRFYPLTIGDDAIAQYNKLRSDAVLFDVPEHPIEISGPGALALLEKVFCRRIAKLKQGRATYAIACGNDGGILMDGVLMRLGGDRYWYVMADGEFLPWLAAQSAGFDATITDPRSWVLQVQGPKAFDVLADLVDGTPPEPFNYFAVAETAIAGERFIISRTGWTGELGFELYSLNPGIDGPSVFGHILKKGRAHGLVFSSLESMGIRRIEAGILDNGTDIDPSMTPYAAGLGKFVDLDKEADFCGKAALAAGPKDVLLTGLTCAGTTPVAGDKVVAGNTQVGRITAGAWSPHLETGIAYLRLDRPLHDNTQPLMLESPDGSRHEAAIVDLPFYDPEKKIPRGLATA
jgi:glycine cleavage system aminomethyltransferase T